MKRREGWGEWSAVETIPAVPDWEDLGFESLGEAMENGYDGPGAPSVLEEAQDIIHGDRNEDYGHPRANHGCTARMVSAYLSRRYDTEIELDAEDVCWFNVLQKVSRQANRAKRDNLTDAVGYIGNIEMLDEPG